jgi:hypothetical protein
MRLPFCDRRAAKHLRKNLLKLDWLEKPGRWKRHPFVDEKRKRKT